MSNAIANGATRAPATRPRAGVSVHWAGRAVLVFARDVRGLLAFTFISLGVLVCKLRVAPAVIWPLVLTQLYRSGLRLLPMVAFFSVVLGLLVIGQTVAMMTRVGANAYLGIVMVTVVVRELGPLLVALLVLSRTGMATVIELATARALGEVEALENLGIDPIHYFVVPRLIGLAVGTFALAVYFILITLASGYLWAFVQDVPLVPADYLQQLAAALDGLDFVLLAVKTAAFGTLIATVSCYHGLARPLRLADVPGVATQAMGQCVVGCLLLDALLILFYLVR